MNVPDAVGVPLIVIKFPAQPALTPVGRPVAAPMPVAPGVGWVMAVSGELMHTVGVDDGAAAVFVAFTVTIVFPEGLAQPLTVATTV